MCVCVCVCEGGEREREREGGGGGGGCAYTMARGTRAGKDKESWSMKSPSPMTKSPLSGNLESLVEQKAKVIMEYSNTKPSLSKEKKAQCQFCENMLWKKGEDEGRLTEEEKCGNKCLHLSFSKQAQTKTENAVKETNIPPHKYACACVCVCVRVCERTRAQRERERERERESAVCVRVCVSARARVCVRA